MRTPMRLFPVFTVIFVFVSLTASTFGLGNAIPVSDAKNASSGEVPANYSTLSALWQRMRDMMPSLSLEPIPLNITINATDVDIPLTFDADHVLLGNITANATTMNLPLEFVSQVMNYTINFGNIDTIPMSMEVNASTVPLELVVHNVSIPLGQYVVYIVMALLWLVLVILCYLLYRRVLHCEMELREMRGRSDVLISLLSANNIAGYGSIGGNDRINNVAINGGITAAVSAPAEDSPLLRSQG